LYAFESPRYLKCSCPVTFEMSSEPLILHYNPVSKNLFIKFGMLSTSLRSNSLKGYSLLYYLTTFSSASTWAHVKLLIIWSDGMKLTDVLKVGSIKKQGMLGNIISRFIAMCGCFDGSVLTVVVFSINGVWRTLYSLNESDPRVTKHINDINPPMQVGLICSGDVLFLK